MAQAKVDNKGRNRTPNSGLGGPANALALSQKRVPLSNFKDSFKRLASEFKHKKLALFTVAMAALLGVIASVATPKVMSLATNQLARDVMDIANGVPGAAINFEYIHNILFLILGISLLSGFFTWVQQIITVHLNQNFVYSLRTRVTEKLDRLPLSYFDKNTHGEILSRITIDIDLLSTNLGQVLSQLINASLTIVAITAMMFWINWVLALVALLAIPMTFLVTSRLAPHSQKHFAAQQEKLGNINGIIEESFSAHIIVKSFNQESRNIAEFKELNDSLHESAYSAQFLASAMMPLVNFVGNLLYVLVVTTASLLSIAGRIMIGDILAFIQYIQIFMQPLNQTAQIANVIQAALAAAERVYLLLDEEEEADESHKPAEIIPAEVTCGQRGAADDFQQKEGSAVCGHVEVKNIRFRYDENTPLIEDLSFEAKPGQTVAIVGPTGAGKTTIVNLLMRFYDIQAGDILIDGESIYETQREGVRAEFGMVLQDTWLFNGSIRDNIAYGREGAREEEIVEAAKVALADHFIRTLPDGYDAILNEDADNISVGQRQLLTIARAVLADAPILILDEATSSVDTRTERLIQKAMVRLMKGRTSFVIAHRLSTIRDADVILVMDKGAVIEKGNHAELLAAEGFYAKLYNSQFEMSED